MGRAWLINLDRRADRLDRTVARFGELSIDVTRIPAIDGASLAPGDLLGVIIAGRRAFNTGEVGCFLSHRKAWRAFLSSVDPYGWVCEDDVEIGPGIEAQVVGAVAAVSAVDPGWDLVYLVRRSRVDEFYAVCDPRDIRSRLDRRDAVADVEAAPGIWRAGPQLGLYSYLVSRRGARRLLAATRTMHNPIDVEVSTMRQLRSFLIPTPLVALHDFGYSDTSPGMFPTEKDAGHFASPR